MEESRSSRSLRRHEAPPLLSYHVCQSAWKKGSDSLSVQRSSLCGHQAGFEQIEVGAAVHLAFDEFQSGDLTFDLTA